MPKERGRARESHPNKQGFYTQVASGPSSPAGAMWILFFFTAGINLHLARLFRQASGNHLTVDSCTRLPPLPHPGFPALPSFSEVDVSGTRGEQGCESATGSLPPAGPHAARVLGSLAVFSRLPGSLAGWRPSQSIPEKPFLPGIWLRAQPQAVPARTPPLVLDGGLPLCEMLCHKHEFFLIAFVSETLKPGSLLGLHDSVPSPIPRITEH